MYDFMIDIYDIYVWFFFILCRCRYMYMYVYICNSNNAYDVVLDKYVCYVV